MGTCPLPDRPQPSPDPGHSRTSSGTRPWSPGRVDRIPTSRHGGRHAKPATARQHHRVRHLVTGATGYIGGRLVPALLAAGRRRALPGPRPRRSCATCRGPATSRWSRRPARRGRRARAPGGRRRRVLPGALAGRPADFEAIDRARRRSSPRPARDGRRAPDRLPRRPAPRRATLSAHLARRARGRRDPARVSGVPTAVLQAAVDPRLRLGVFEMLRYLTERLPVMVTPQWVRTRIQPIAVRDVLHYLVAPPGLPDGVNRTFDIGGPDVLTLPRDDAALRRGRRAAAAGHRAPVPVLTPAALGALGRTWSRRCRGRSPCRSSSRCVHEVVCREHDIADTCRTRPRAARLRPGRRAGAGEMQAGDVETRWSDAARPGAAGDPLPSDPDWAGGTCTSTSASAPCRAGPSAVAGHRAASAESTAGTRSRWPGRCAAGWTGSSAASGCAAAAATRDRLHAGDALDCWRVERARATGAPAAAARGDEGCPGRAWLELTRASPAADGGTRLPPAGHLPPRAGWPGTLYWWAVAPFHGAGLRRHGPQHHAAAERDAGAEPVTPSACRRAFGGGCRPDCLVRVAH